MKKLFTVALLLVSTAILAEQKIKIATFPGSYSDSISLKFEVNKELGRAWVSATFSDHDPDSLPCASNFKVPGLSYSKELNSVVYVKDGVTTVCSKMVTKGKGIFKLEKFEDVNCTLKIELTERLHDDGFNIYKVSEEIAYLVIK